MNDEMMVRAIKGSPVPKKEKTQPSRRYWLVDKKEGRKATGPRPKKSDIKPKELPELLSGQRCPVCDHQRIRENSHCVHCWYRYPRQRK